MARAIVTYSRGWHSLAVVRSLGRNGVDVYCGEEAPFAPCFFSRYCTGHFQYPSVTNDPDGFIDYMVEKVQELKPDDPDEPYVLLPVHKETWLIAKHRERFEPHIRVPLTSYENMATLHDKGSLAEVAAEMGITIPGTRQFTSQDALFRAIPEIEFPVFLKVREGASGVGLKKCNTPEELTGTFREFVDGYGLQPSEYPLVQEFIDGDDYCLATLFDSGECVATMVYRNVRSFPRGTGAGVLRETVSMPDAEEAARKLLSARNWHGMAQLDFRKGKDGTAYLIEVNPRFFGGLTQAIAANVDFPWLVFQIASGQKIEQKPEVDYSTRTEAPVVGLLATLEEIAHDERALDRVRIVRDELKALGNSPLDDIRLKPFWDTIRNAANPHDVKAYLKEMFATHEDTINDVMQSDDPRPAMGFLFPLALMLKHGKLSMGLLTAEQEIESDKPRRSFRDMLRHPSWRAVALTAALYAVSLFTVNADATAGNIGLVLGAPFAIANQMFGAVTPEQLGTLAGSIQHTLYHLVTLGVWYLVSAALLSTRPDQA